MKIIINYDLLDKIREAKIGISLHRTTKAILILSGLCTGICSILVAFTCSPEELPKEIFKITIKSVVSQSFYRLITELLTFIPYKIISKEQLRQLSSQLKDIKVNTDKDLILDSYKYKTEYKWIKSEKDIDLVQKKYIMIPVIENGEEKEVSILQEHAIGSKTHSLSIGEPTKQKVFKLALNPI